MDWNEITRRKHIVRRGELWRQKSHLFPLCKHLSNGSVYCPATHSHSLRDRLVGRTLSWSQRAPHTLSEHIIYDILQQALPACNIEWFQCLQIEYDNDVAERR